MATTPLEVPQIFRAPVDFTRGGSAGEMSEWPSSYQPTKPPEPPMNMVISSPGGHSIQLDSNPEARRVSIIHATGSHVEMYPDGGVKYKSTKNRQDVTIGDHEIIIRGDFNITVDGGSKILIRNGALEIQSDSGAAINVKGELKLNADNILMRAKEKIALYAPFVDLGGTPLNSYVKLPYSIIPIFGVPVVRMTGLPIPTALAGNNAAVPSDGGSSLPAVVSTVTGLVNSVAGIAKSINDVRRYAALGIGGGVAVVKLIRDASGNPIVPETEQPTEIPLSNPRLYVGTSVDNARMRDRQFDSPEDVDDTEAYTAHLNLSVKLGDLVESDKDLPGEVYASDETKPISEPPPVYAFALDYGTVACEYGNATVVGTDTMFTEEVKPGDKLIIAGSPTTVSSVPDDATVILTTPWANANVSAQTAYVRIYRPIGQFFGTYEYPLSTPLGRSSLTLADMMRGFIPPTIEKTIESVPVPTAIQPPPPSVPAGGNGGSGGPGDPGGGGTVPLTGDRFDRPTWENTGTQAI